MNLVSLYLLAFGGAFVTAILSLPFWLARCRRAGLMDDPGHRKIHSTPIPLAGGLGVLTALIVPAAVGSVVVWFEWLPAGADTLNALKYGLSHRFLELGAIFLGAIGMLAVGLLDDRFELRPSTKFASQFAVALLVALSGVRVTLFVPSVLFSYAITLLWILTLINAFNFMDNMNGLCAGLGAIGAGFFAAVSGAAGQYLVALIASLTCGALLGFLPYNFPRARSFLGDSGSHLVGYLLAVLAILPHFHTPEQPHTLAVIKPLFFLSVPLGDLVWVVFLRWKMGKPFYVGDTNHLSHRLVRAGLTRTQSVLLIWGMALAIGGLAMAW